MFTGIIKGVGQVLEQAELGGDRRLTIDTQGVDLPALHDGDSVAVNGVCLTVANARGQQFCADVSLETLRVTTLGDLTVGAGVNLEPALRLGGSLDGHLLTGHVDGIGQVTDIQQSARSVVIQFEVAENLAPYIARKGAVAVDGVSLTVMRSRRPDSRLISSRTRRKKRSLRGTKSVPLLILRSISSPVTLNG